MDQYNRPSSPMPDLGLPQPWIAQFDEQSQTPYFVNTQTGQSSWQHPVDGSTFHPSSGNGDDAYGGAASSSSSATGTRGMGDVGQGHAASFYGSSGPAADTYGSPSTAYNNDPNATAGERGMGSKIAIGGLAYLAYKMYQKHQKQNQHQSYGKPQHGGYYGGGHTNSFMGTALGAGAGGMIGNYLMGGKRDMGPDNASTAMPGQSRDYLYTPADQGLYGGTSTPGYDQPTGHQSGWMPPPPPNNGGWSAPPLPENGFDSFNGQPDGPIISYGGDANGSYGGSQYGQSQYDHKQYQQQQGYGQNPPY